MRTRTELSKAVDVLEKVYGRFGEGELAHCFQEENDITAGGYSIRKIDASKIRGDASVRVVFFKMALTTGWDCPRAEVMMSFRKATDHTLIAQLVGRMVGLRWHVGSRRTSFSEAWPCSCRTMTKTG